MKIYLEWDDGERRHLGNGGARRFQAMLKKYGHKDNVVVGYHHGKAKMRGFTWVWPTETTVVEYGDIRIQRAWVSWHTVTRG